MKTLRSILLSAILLGSMAGFAQHGRGHGHGHGHPHGGRKVVVVKRSPYRPARLVVYHPVWHPAYACNRRWVYFPRYNFYWDNWRNHYVFWNGTIWLSQPTAPAMIVNVNLASEKRYELKDDDDDVDDIYASNGQHKTEYKN